VLSAGLLGAVVLIAWTFVVNGVLGFQSRLDMKQIPAERQVYEVLQQHIVEPGRYIFNPPSTTAGQPPGEGPVFSALFSGVGHEAAGGLMVVGLVGFLLAPLLGAWLLAQASDQILASHLRKVLFFVALGLLLALVADIPKYGIGNYPLPDALAYAGNRLVAWTLVGLVVAWRITPRSGGGSES
jgi:hypothetical protein